MTKKRTSLTTQEIVDLLYTTEQIQERGKELGIKLSRNRILAACRRQPKTPYGVQLDAVSIGKSTHITWLVSKKSAETWLQYQFKKFQKKHK